MLKEMNDSCGDVGEKASVFHLGVSEDLAEGATKPPEKARKLVHASRRGHIDATHDVYELRKSTDKQKIVRVDHVLWLIWC